MQLSGNPSVSRIGRLRWALVIVAFIGCQAPPALADHVVLKVGAGNAVPVRERPSGDSDKVGELGPGDRAEFLGSVPHWFEIRLADGTPGYVNKQKAELVPDGPTVVTPTVGTGHIFTLHAIDVGTGLSIFVEGPDFTVLYDAGSNDDRAQGPSNRVLAYLALTEPNLTTIDEVILSHPHRDHLELLADVITRYDVREVWDSGAINNTLGYERFLAAVEHEPSVIYRTAAHDAGPITVIVQGTAHSLLQGLRISTDEVIPLGHTGQASMHFLHADGSHHANPNENSLVMRMDLGPVRVLFMGDAESGPRDSWDDGVPVAGSIEAALLACCPTEIDADVLIVGHHGSKTSSRTMFLDAVSADTFVVSSGPTKYGSVVLPDAEVIAALAARGTVLRTDVDDQACGNSNEKVGGDSDHRAGGCSNIRLTIGPGNSVTSAVWVGDEDID